MADTTELEHISLANEGNRVRITPKKGSPFEVTVIERADDDRRGNGMRVRYPDGSIGAFYDNEMGEDYVVEVLHRR